MYSNKNSYPNFVSIWIPVSCPLRGTFWLSNGPFVSTCLQIQTTAVCTPWLENVQTDLWPKTHAASHLSVQSLFILSESEHGKNLFFDFCCWSMRTWNWILYELIWKRHRFRSYVAESLLVENVNKCWLINEQFLEAVMVCSHCQKHTDWCRYR